MRRYILALMLLFTLVTMGLERDVVRWDFQGIATLKERGMWHIDLDKPILQDGVFHSKIIGADPILTFPLFDGFRTSPWQAIEVRMRCAIDGDGEFFYTNTTESNYAGFRSDWSVRFSVKGDGEWHVYRIYPPWNKLGRIIRIRLDFPPARAKGLDGTVEVDYLRVVDFGETSRVISAPVAWNFRDGHQQSKDWALGDGDELPNGTAAGATIPGNSWITLKDCTVNGENCGKYLLVRMATRSVGRCVVRWISESRGGWSKAMITPHGDGAYHTYVLDMSRQSDWGKKTTLFQICPSDEEGIETMVESIGFYDQMEVPADPLVIRSGMADGVNRVGSPVKFQTLLCNNGYAATGTGHLSKLELPSGVWLSSLNSEKCHEIGSIPAGESAFHTIWLEAEKPIAGEVRMTIEFPGISPLNIVGQVEFTASLKLPAADYVPEPHPISTGDYLVGALYFPGWDGKANGGWKKIWKSKPERKPLLGWYDEGNPEAIDWQIKWLVENGIQYLAVDWYWNKGHRHLEHWLKGFERCRYRKYLKWAVMWANHNGPKSHSEEDMRQVARWWIEHCFSMPEYLTIDGKPLVMIWNVHGMKVDMQGKGGVARLNEIVQEEARAAGYPGVHMCAMKVPENINHPEVLQKYKDSGFESTFIYRYRDLMGKINGRRRFPFQELVDTSMDFWRSRLQCGVMPFFVNITTGWSDRPWQDSLDIYGKTPENFRQLCQLAKNFADETGKQKWLMLGPLNEWGEGSYIDPCTEYGFTMYEAIRDVFGVKPEGGWPQNYAPSDVNLGPYDFPESP